jgi:meiotically up-regulated gene 157 (Mug157) protein
LKLFPGDILVQSVFLKLWENYKILKKESSFKSYLFTIAYNDICKLFRKRNYLKKYVSDTLYENSQSFSETEDGIDYKSILEQVQQIVDKTGKGPYHFGRKTEKATDALPGNGYGNPVKPVGLMCSSFLPSDDANIPGLLSLPYMDCIPDSDPLYINTRKFALYEDNPWYFKGKAGAGSCFQIKTNINEEQIFSSRRLTAFLFLHEP